MCKICSEYYGEQSECVNQTFDASAGYAVEVSKEVAEEIHRLHGRIADLETTIRTFLHDLDAHEERVKPSEIRMNNAMWLQVQAFRNLFT